MIFQSPLLEYAVDQQQRILQFMATNFQQSYVMKENVKHHSIIGEDNRPHEILTGGTIY